MVSGFKTTTLETTWLESELDIKDSTRSCVTSFFSEELGLDKILELLEGDNLEVDIRIEEVDLGGGGGSFFGKFSFLVDRRDENVGEDVGVKKLDMPIEFANSKTP